LILDDYSHFAWTYPLRFKSDAFAAIRRFHALVTTHFSLPVLTLQADNGCEFDNQAARAFFDSHGIALRMSCPYTSAQNGRAERMLRTLNETVRAQLTHASMPPAFWAEALTTATFLLNRRPCRARQYLTPFELLHCAPPDYSNMRVFGCLCFPNMTATTPHKLAPRSTPCVFLGYSAEHKGYRCLDRVTGRVIISRHVFFDEAQFPFASSARSAPAATDAEEPTLPGVPEHIPLARVPLPATVPRALTPAPTPAHHITPSSSCAAASTSPVMSSLKPPASRVGNNLNVFRLVS
jgi:hypothetical protein